MIVKLFKNYLIPPVSIYGAVFLFISALIGAKIDQHASWVWLTTLGITMIGLFLATRYVKPTSSVEGLKYGAVWLIVLLILDLVLTLPFTGPSYFSDWRSYLPYILTLIEPVIFQ